MGRVVRGTNCPWGELSVGRAVCGANSPWGELSMGRAVHGASCRGASCRGKSFDGASFDAASCPGTKFNVLGLNHSVRLYWFGVSQYLNGLGENLRSEFICLCKLSPPRS